MKEYRFKARITGSKSWEYEVEGKFNIPDGENPQEYVIDKIHEDGITQKNLSIVSSEDHGFDGIDDIEIEEIEENS